MATDSVSIMRGLKPMVIDAAVMDIPLYDITASTKALGSKGVRSSTDSPVPMN